MEKNKYSDSHLLVLLVKDQLPVHFWISLLKVAPRKYLLRLSVFILRYDLFCWYVLDKKTNKRIASVSGA